MSFLAHRRFRRIHALLLCTLWLVGFEVGPGLHIALHDQVGHHHHGSTTTEHEHVAALEQGSVEHGHGEAELATHGHAQPHGHDPAEHHEHEPTGHDEAEHHDHGHHAAAHGHDDPEDASSEHGEQPSSQQLHDLESGDAHEPPATPVLAEVVARCANDRDHGAHALAHRGIAASPTPPAWPPVAVAPWVYLSRASFALDPIRSRAPRCARARGPPGLS